MGLSRILGQYADIKPILDAALASNGGTYELTSRNQAIRWRQRAYQYRKLLRERSAAAAMLPGIEPTTPYDSMKITVEESTCVIDFYRPMGKWTANDGSELDPFKVATDTAEDELSRAAEEFAKGLLGETK